MVMSRKLFFCVRERAYGERSTPFRLIKFQWTLWVFNPVYAQRVAQNTVDYRIFGRNRKSLWIWIISHPQLVEAGRSAMSREIRIWFFNILFGYLIRLKGIPQYNIRLSPFKCSGTKKRPPKSFQVQVCPKTHPTFERTISDTSFNRA